jgi:hypothetical protein
MRHAATEIVISRTQTFTLMKTMSDDLECPQCRKLADLLMSELVFVHERKIAEVDEALKPFLGREDAPVMDL